MVASSVIVPCFQIDDYLLEAITSILSDGPDDIEIVVVDDGSDPPLDIVEIRPSSANVRVIRRSHAGAGGARNAGVLASSGHRLFFLDADDLWSPGRFSNQMGTLDADPRCLSFGLIEEFLDPDTNWGEYPRPRVRRLDGPSVITLACARATFDRVGPFREDLATGEFIDWLLRARSMGVPETVLPQVLASRRIHRFNRDRARRAESGTYVDILRGHLKTLNGSAVASASEEPAGSS